MSDLPVVFNEIELSDGRKLGMAQLNAPKALNALSLTMIEQLLPQLTQWATDETIAAVWLEGHGDKAFCAGGDIVELYRSMTEINGQGDPAQSNPYAERFFATEYRLDYLIHTFPKPFIVWGNGIVMGGGMGLFAGANCRVVTEHSRLAMPEITIGLYPDVGGSWFLNRMPGRCGLFLGLTGAQMNAADALFVGLADRFIAHEHRAAVIEALQGLTWGGSDAACVQQVMRQFEQQSHAQKPDSTVQAHYETIQQLTDADSALGRVQKITAYAGEDPWLKRAAETLSRGSTTSMLLIQAQLQRCLHNSLVQVFQQELNLSIQCALKGEFSEGIRALLIDKDRRPRWHYATAEQVEDGWIDGFFAPLWPQNPLSDLAPMQVKDRLTQHNNKIQESTR